MQNCTKCGEEIHPLRLKAVPNTKVCHLCIRNNDVDRVAGVSVISGKNTYSELQIVTQEEAKYVNHMQNRKGSIVSNGVRGLRSNR